ncbi:MAG: RNA polymerase sigma factor [Sandaracinaceae bacterium]
MSEADAAERVRRSIEAVWKVEAPRLIGGLVRVVRDLDLAEDLAHDALLAALETWPERGIPPNPGAWLMLTARHRAVDRHRRRRVRDEKHGQLAASAEASFTPDLARGIDEDVGDDLLRLMLVACHPILAPEARVALTLRLLGGLTTKEIARAFLSREATVAQRIVRAKRTLAEARVPFEVPRGEALQARVASVLEVVYLIFNEGYAATSGDAVVRRELAEDALRLGRVLAGLVPEDAEAHGLVALMELQSSRFRARVDGDGAPVLLEAQDRSRWDRLAIQRGLASLRRAEGLARPLGPYALQASIAACHARAPTAEATDWPRIVALYDALSRVSPSPVVDLNRAVAVGRAYGVDAALAALDALADEPALRGYPFLPSVRAHFLERQGRLAEAEAALEVAIELTRNDRDRALLEQRRALLAARR